MVKKKRSKKTTKTAVKAKTASRPQGLITGLDVAQHVRTNLNFYLSGLITLILSAGVWLYFKEPVTRFSFVMPIIATWIFYLIMTEIDDEK
ncbi:MAG: hypothetical protein GXP43_00895 [bacterium]|nr:hypothetical protein [bacterium]